MTDYQKANELGLISADRCNNGEAHHSMSVRLMKFIEEHDYKDYGDFFCWKTGGAGDNGEILMYEMDSFFELLDGQELKQTK